MCSTERCYPASMQNVQPVDERHYALLQRVQRVLLGVVVSEVVPQTPESVSEQLDLLCLQNTRENRHRSPSQNSRVGFNISIH